MGQTKGRVIEFISTYKIYIISIFAPVLILVAFFYGNNVYQNYQTKNAVFKNIKELTQNKNITEEINTSNIKYNLSYVGNNIKISLGNQSQEVNYYYDGQKWFIDAPNFYTDKYLYIQLKDDDVNKKINTKELMEYPSWLNQFNNDIFSDIIKKVNYKSIYKDNNGVYQIVLDNTFNFNDLLKNYASNQSKNKTITTISNWLEKQKINDALIQIQSNSIHFTINYTNDKSERGKIEYTYKTNVNDQLFDINGQNSINIDNIVTK